MAFRLSRLRFDTALTDPKTGRPTPLYIRWWQALVEQIEAAIFDLTETISRIATVEADVTTAQATADAAGALAATKLGPSDIGVTVQAYSGKLNAYSGGDTPSAFTLGIVDSADAAAWRAAIGAGTSSNPGTVTSVNASGGTTGLTFTGGPITGFGTLTLSGTVSEANGGTGFSSYLQGDMIYAASGSALARLGIGATGSVLTSNGTLPGWTASTGTGSIVRATSPAITTPSLTSPTISGSAGNLLSGTYTPTITNIGNVTSAIAATFQYMRVGAVVTVSGKVAIAATSAAATEIAISLPIASNFSAVENCAGTGLAPLGNQIGGVRADAANDYARLWYVAVTTATVDMMVHFTYRII